MSPSDLFLRTDLRFANSLTPSGDGGFELVRKQALGSALQNSTKLFSDCVDGHSQDNSVKLNERELSSNQAASSQLNLESVFDSAADANASVCVGTGTGAEVGSGVCTSTGTDSGVGAGAASNAAAVAANVAVATTATTATTAAAASKDLEGVDAASAPQKELATQAKASALVYAADADAALLPTGPLFAADLDQIPAQAKTALASALSPVATTQPQALTETAAATAVAAATQAQSAPVEVAAPVALAEGSGATVKAQAQAQNTAATLSSASASVAASAPATAAAPVSIQAVAPAPKEELTPQAEASASAYAAASDAALPPVAISVAAGLGQAPAQAKITSAPVATPQPQALAETADATAVAADTQAQAAATVPSKPTSVAAAGAGAVVSAAMSAATAANAAAVAAAAAATNATVATSGDGSGGGVAVTAEVPKKALKPSLLAHSVSTAQSERNRGLVMSSYRGKPEPAEVREILNFLDCSDREQWFKTFAILGREYQNDFGIYHIAQQWARAYSKRKPEDERKEHYEFFVSSRAPGPGIGALIAEAKRHGYKVPRSYEKHVQDYERYVRQPAKAKETEAALQPLEATVTPDSLDNLLYSKIQQESNAVVNFWLYKGGNGADPERKNFLNDNAKYFRFLPVGQRTILEAMLMFCKERTEYSYGAFCEWLKLNDIELDSETLLAVFNTKSATSAAATYDFMLSIYHTSYALVLQRELTAFADGVLERSFEENTTQLRECYESVLPVCEDKVGYKEQWPSDVTRVCLERIENSNSMELFVPTGHKLLDAHIMGFRRGGVTIFAAHSGSGKSWFAVDAAFRLLLQHEEARVLFFSSEMSNDEIELRFFGLFNDVGINTEDIERSYADGSWHENMRRFQAFSEGSTDITLVGTDSGEMSISSIENKVAAMSATRRLDLVIVDYLQNIVNSNQQCKNSCDRVRDTMQRLCHMARRYNCAVLVLAQLNNPNRKQSETQPPNLYDIADASYVVMPADAVIIMYKILGKGGNDISGMGAGFVDEMQGNLFSGVPEQDANAVGAAEVAAAAASAGASVGGTGGIMVTSPWANIDSSQRKSIKQLFGTDRFFNQTNLLLSVCKSRHGFNTERPLSVLRSKGSRFCFVQS